MYYSTLTEIPTTRSNIDAFGGYNHNLRISDGEFYDMQNLCSDHYPLLSPRAKRGAFAYPTDIQMGTHKTNGIMAKDALCYVDGSKLYVNNIYVRRLVLTDTPKTLVSMGAYVIVFPDKVYVNTKDFNDYGSLEAFFNKDKEIVGVTYEMCKVDGDQYLEKDENGNTNYHKGNEPPTDPSKCPLWIDTSTTPNTLKQYSSANSTWSQIATTYIKISAPNIANSFSQYDAVKISGLPTDVTAFKNLEGHTSPLWAVFHDKGDASVERAEGTDDYVVVVGFLGEAITRSTSLCIERRVPVMDFVIESGNRLWGCRYGRNADGAVVNEIYASKLGDIKNWFCYMGLSTDSYAVSCGSDGQWTGAITHLGYPLFFKENCLHKIYGNFPANYQVQTTACRGVQKGAGKSLAIVNEALFYKSRNGICVYDGSLPTEISTAFGDIRYSAVDDTDADDCRNGAVGGSHNNKYYISMKSEKDGKWHLFVFDTATNLWHREDNTRVDAFCSCDGEMYYIDHEDKQIKTILGSGIKDDTDISWYAESGVIGISMTDKKYVSGIVLRLSLAIGSVVKILAQYDSCGEWESVATVTGNNLRSFSLPIRPQRCDHFRIRIEGVGDAKIYSITKTIEQGGDIHGY
jgi:hypothetical protein